MDDVVWLEFEQVRDVVELLLRDYLNNAFEGADNGGALLVVHVGEALVGGDCGIGQDADRDIAELGGLFDDVEVAGVDDVRRHRDID